MTAWLSALLLALSVPLVPVAYMAVAVGALGLRLRLPVVSGWERALIVAINLLAVPFVWEAIIPGRLEVAALVLAAFPWLLHMPEEHRDQELLAVGRPGRGPTRRLIAIAAAFAGAAATSLITGHAILALSATVTLGLVALAVGVSLIRFRPHLLSIDTAPVRALAGQPCRFRTVLNVDPRAFGHIHLTPDVPWAHVEPSKVDGEATLLDVRLVPPLAGSGTVNVHLIWTDPWGLTGSTMDRPLARLRVIPRAAYAAWLARRYLETSRGAGATAVIVPDARPANTRRGLEYYGARHYEAGDTLRDILWKHTAKTGRFVVQDRRDDLAQAAILAVRLAGRDADEADRLAYHLLMTTLTLAQEGVPVAFAPYAPDGPESTTPSLASRPAVQHALRLSERVRVVPAPRRVLEPAQPARLRRTLSRLQQSESTPAARLAAVLSFELRAHMTRARRHPASRALARVVGHLHAPAIIIVISGLADDAEVLNFTLEDLGARGFQRMNLLAVSA